MNKIFTPSTNSDSTTDDSHALSNDQSEKYKTEMCKNWIENRICRYGKKCQFAHGYDELATFQAAAHTGDKTRTKNCRTFYQTKICNYGSRCMFRHEHRHFNQIHRHHYYAKLYTLESLYQYSKNQTEFLNTHESDVHKLAIFEQIHAEGAEEDDDEEASETFSCVNDSEQSFIEMEEDIIAFCDPDIKSPTACDE
jgi:hypothetical protein